MVVQPKLSHRIAVWPEGVPEISEPPPLLLCKGAFCFCSVSLAGFLRIESKMGLMKCKLLYGYKPSPLPEVIKPDGIWYSYGICGHRGA